MRLALLALLAFGCTGRTEIVVGVATDLRAKGQIDLVRFTASRNGVPLFSHEWPLSDVPAGMYELPGSFGIFSSDGSEPRVDLSLLAFQGNNMIADRESVLSLVSGQTLFLRMGVTSACNLSNGIKCASDESCVEGICEKRLLDAHLLPKYRPELVTSVDCSSTVHYIDSSTGVAMPVLKSSCAGNDVCHEGTCLHSPSSMTMQPQFDASFCIPTDGGIDDGGIQVLSTSDLRFTYPIEVALSCTDHFFPYEVTLDTGESLSFTAFQGSHHLMGPSGNTGDIVSQMVTMTFNTVGEFEVSCLDHPTAGKLKVHVPY